MSFSQEAFDRQQAEAISKQAIKRRRKLAKEFDKRERKFLKEQLKALKRMEKL